MQGANPCPYHFYKLNRKEMHILRGKKTTPEDIYNIMTSWAVTGSYSETARELNMAQSTVEKIVKENKDKEEFVKVCDEKKSEFSEKASRIIDKALKRLEKEIDNKDRDIPINHLTTVIGTLYDKKALCDGNATGKISVEVKLPEGIDDYAG